MRRTLSQVEGHAEVEARTGLGRLYERDWRLAAAQRELELALASTDRPGLVQLNLARVLLKRGDLDGATAAVAEDHPEVPPTDAARIRGDIAKAAGRYEVAHEEYGKARKFAGDYDDMARVNAAECDLFQLERRLAPARQRCELALKRQVIGDADRPGTLKTLGLIYFFGGEPKRALGLHTRSMEGFAALGNDFEARWMREYAIDDEAALVEDGAPALSPLIDEMQTLIAKLHVGSETIWWRVSDAQLRLADLLRRAQRFEDAKRAVQLGLEAFQQRPAGWERVPDYATVFELAGLIAKDQGELRESRDHLTRSLEVLESIVGLSVDASYLREEIDQLSADIETANTKAKPIAVVETQL